MIFWGEKKVDSLTKKLELFFLELRNIKWIVQVRIYIKYISMEVVFVHTEKQSHTESNLLKRKTSFP